MERLNGLRMRLMLIGFVAAIVLGGESAKADFTFGQRVNLGPTVNSPYADYDPFIAPDGLSLYFSSTRLGGFGKEDIWVTTRTSIEDPWGPPVHLGAPINTEYSESWPSITADGLMLAFSADTPGGLGGRDIWISTRPTRESPWGLPMNLGAPINSTRGDMAGCISPDGCSLYFSTSLEPSSSDPEVFYGGDVYMTTRPTTDSPWGAPVKLELMPPRNGSGNWNPSLSADGLALFFDSDYMDISLFPDIWLATRTSNDSEWGTPILLGPEINTQDGEQKSSISADGSTLYWSSGTRNWDTWDLWQSTISPIVDFNSDGNIDTSDMVMLIDGWGTDDKFYDIGPMPWGDGVVDVEDLIVFMKYWEQENMPSNPQEN